MSRADLAALRLQRVRNLRTAPERDLSLGMLREKFKKEIAKPHKQVEAVIEFWKGAVPEKILKHTRLEGMSRGVLHVAVDSSPHRYELQRLLDQGLERQLIAACKSVALRRVKVGMA